MPRATPYELVTCTCSICRKKHFVDPISRLTKRGDSVPGYVRQKHEQDDRKNAETRVLFQSFLRSDAAATSAMDVCIPSVPPPLPECERLPRPVSDPPNVSDDDPENRDIIKHRLSSISERLKAHRTDVSVNANRIVFAKPPYLYSERERLFPPPGYLDLLDGHQPNIHLLDEERWIASALNFLLHEGAALVNCSKYAEYSSELVAALNQRVREVQQAKCQIWNEQVKDVALWTTAQPRTVNTIRHMTKPFLHWRRETLTCYLIACAAHLFLKTSLSGAGLLLLLLKNLMGMFEETRADPFLPTGALQSSIPAKMETVLKRLQLEPKTRPYVTCSSCFMTYPYNADASYPDTCQHKLTPTSSPCNASLSKKCRYSNGTVGRVPVRLYLHHELEDWIAQLYSRPEIEELLDRDLRLKNRNSVSSELVRDICESAEIQNFLGRDGKPFIQKPGREGRLLFSLNMDGLNPYHNMEAGKKVSICAIYMVLLILPLDIRYDIDNMFLVGVVPGPVEPSKDQINHILRLLVDDLCIFWDPGYYVVATAKYPAGRLVIGALVILVCDLLASRQMSGCASHMSNNFCAFCLLKSKDMNNFDFEHWPKRSREEHMQLAQAWKSADSEVARGTLYDASGVRWSELLRLPYWDPTRFVVIDVMHAFFLGLLKHHLRNIWGMDAAIEEKDPFYSTASEAHSRVKLEVARQALENRDYVLLGKARQIELRQLCREYNLPYGGRKQAVLATLIKYAAHDADPSIPVDHDENDAEEDDPDSDNEGESMSAPGKVKGRGVIIGKQTLGEIRRDMELIALPSWVSPAPKRPGESKTGKLSADQWKTLCTVNLVITLGRLWNKPRRDGVNDTDIEARKRSMYTNFMHLVSAVKLGSMRSMTPERIHLYTHHIHRYLTTLQELYPWTGITPNQHNSLHLPDMLSRFGPTPGWRCYAFERYNSLLQNTLTNNRFGDLERTIFKKFCQGQNLRVAFQKHRVPAAMQPLMGDLKKRLFKSMAPETGTLTEDLFATHRQEEEFDPKEAKDIPLIWLSLLTQWIRHFEPSCNVENMSQQMNLLKKTERRGEIYSAFSHNPRNSMVYYQEPNGHKWPARIGAIFRHERQSSMGYKAETFVILERFQALSVSDRHNNPYSFEQSNHLFLNEFYVGLTISALKDVLYHFGSYPYQLDGDIDAFLALPLDKI